jgi:hypothetical protein
LIGFDFPLKPQWIHDVHALWKPEQPVSELIECARAETMQELGGKTTRNKTLTIILRHFLKTEGGGNSRQTASQDVWVSFSRTYSAQTLSPAYLSHLIAQSEVAQESTQYVKRRYVPGDLLTTGELREHVTSIFGERKVVENAASAFVRTLYYFGVFKEARGPGAYRFQQRLAVPHAIFPLIVWGWWREHKRPQIDLRAFMDDPAVAFLESSAFDRYWAAYTSELWSLEERIEGRRAALKYSDEEALEKALLRLPG